MWTSWSPSGVLKGTPIFQNPAVSFRVGGRASSIPRISSSNKLLHFLMQVICTSDCKKAPTDRQALPVFKGSEETHARSLKTYKNPRKRRAAILAHATTSRKSNGHQSDRIGLVTLLHRSPGFDTFPHQSSNERNDASQKW